MTNIFGRGRFRKTTELQDSDLVDDIAELRGVLNETQSSINMHANHSLVTSQSIINHDNHIAHANDTTHSLTNTQSLTVTHTIQPFILENSQSTSYASKNFHLNTTQTFTHKPHTSTHMQHIGSRLNTLHDTQIQASNIWPTSNHFNSSSSSIAAPGELQSLRSEIEVLHRKVDLLTREVQKTNQKLDKIYAKMSNNQRQNFCQYHQLKIWKYLKLPMRKNI